MEAAASCKPLLAAAGQGRIRPVRRKELHYYVGLLCAPCRFDADSYDLHRRACISISTTSQISRSFYLHMHEKGLSFYSSLFSLICYSFHEAPNETLCDPLRLATCDSRLSSSFPATVLQPLTLFSRRPLHHPTYPTLPSYSTNKHSFSLRFCFSLLNGRRIHSLSNAAMTVN